jgi:hypothetical protein
MAKVRFVPQASGFRELLHSAELSAFLEGKAQAVASAARSGAPVDSGEYAESIDVVMDDHPTRVVAHVVATAEHAMVVEANTGNLARALDAAG